MKVLYIGDMHVQISNLDESDALMNFVVDTIIKHKPDQVVLLGDLLHNFAVVRTEVLDFWKEWLDTISESQKLIVLVGNHDLANSGNDQYKSHALNVFHLMKKKTLSIVDNAQVHGVIGFVPYMHDQTKFVEIANGLKEFGAKILVVHQDIDGSQYESGFYAPNGVSPDKLDYPLVIGGHIHKRQRFGKIVLPGTPRWLNNADANEEKGLWLVDHDDNTGLIVNEEFIDTSSVCAPIYQLSYKEGDSEPTIPIGSRVTLEMVGSSDWIAKEKLKFKGKANIKTKITDYKKTENRKTGKSLEDFIKNVFTTSLDKEDLLKYAKEIGLV
jgi:DNA repair exonuclease SbcCD nuclease subunit